MRVKKTVNEFRGIAHLAWVALVLCALAPEAVAGGQVPATPSLWATATALGLMLITAVSSNQK
jgi:hypothetical protein